MSEAEGSHGEELGDDKPTESPPPPLYDGQQCFCCRRIATLWSNMMYRRGLWSYWPSLCTTFSVAYL